MERLPLQLKIRIRRQPRARSMRRPLMLQQALVRIDIAVLPRIRRPRRTRAILRIRPVRVLRPQPMQHKRWLRRTLHIRRMRHAILRRPRQRQQIKIKHPGRSTRLRSRSPRPRSTLAALRKSTSIRRRSLIRRHTLRRLHRPLAARNHHCPTSQQTHHQQSLHLCASDVPRILQRSR